MNLIYESSIQTIPNFGRLQFNLNDVEIRNDAKDPRRVRSVAIDGQEFKPSTRFLNSLFSRYGFGTSIYQYFTPAEMIERICKVRTDTALEVTVELPNQTSIEPKAEKLLAINAPDEKDIDLPRLFSAGQRMGQTIQYSDGKVWFHVVPDSGHRPVKIGPDEFHNRFVMELSVDGYGKIRNYLELVRYICSNGAIGYAPAFASHVQPGKDVMASIERALASFDNPDGFVALQRRFEIAQSTAPSLFEWSRFNKALDDTYGEDSELGDVQKALANITNTPFKKWGIMNPDQLVQSKQRKIDMNGTMYDLINLASELTTHKLATDSGRALVGWMGETLSSKDGFDLEGLIPTSQRPEAFKDFHYVN